MDSNEKENKLIPKINKKISDFLYEEEGNISRGKILTVGSLLLVAGILFADEVYGAHRSHSSHGSHSSHSSSSYGGGGHSSHESHQSHQSHQSGSTHSNHSSSATTHSSHSSSTTTTPSHNNTAVTQSESVTVKETLPDFQKPQIPPSTPEIK